MVPLRFVSGFFSPGHMFRVAVLSGMVSSWRSCSSWGRGGSAKVDVALTGGTHGSSWPGCVLSLCCNATLT